MATAEAMVVISRMSRGEKIQRVAPYLPCAEQSHAKKKNDSKTGSRHATPATVSTCRCDGWKNPASSEPVVPMPKSRGRPPIDACAQCGHSMALHGSLGTVSTELLDQRVLLVAKIEQYLKEYKRVADPNQKKHLGERVVQLKAQLVRPQTSFSSPKPLPAGNVIVSTSTQVAHGGVSRASDAAVGSAMSAAEALRLAPPSSSPMDLLPKEPPFERPTIKEIVENFTLYRYANKFGESKKRAIDKLHKLLISSANKFILPAPIDEKDPQYNLFYDLWKRCCKGGVVANSAAKMKPAKTDRGLNTSSQALTNCFGRRMLETLLIHLQDNMTANYHLTRDMENFVNTFFKDLTAEVKDDLSIVHQLNFKPTYEKIIRLEAQLDAELAEKEESLTSRGFYEPKYGPWAKSKATPGSKRSFTEMQSSGMTSNSTAERKAAAERAATVLPDAVVERARDHVPKTEEKSGVLTSKIVRNDDDPENLHYLIQARNIFCKQLPKMPKDYISRLVFDHHHQTLVLLKLDVVVGGISFHPFYDNGFIEIAFCAITANEQVKGYGTHLMNHLKAQLQPQKLLTFLTYADNYAIGYFKKQGFTKYVTTPREKWAGFIKDYDGGTLMECRVHTTINYLQIPEMVRKQRAAIYEKVKENSMSHIKYPGTRWFKTSNKRMPYEKIKGLSDSRWKLEERSQEDIETLHVAFGEILKAIQSHTDSWPFHEPVSFDEVPDYYEVIKDPIDMQMIQKRFDTGSYYITKHIFFADLKRMCDNCRTYNRNDTVFFKCANTIEKLICDKGGAPFFKKK